jgi:metal-sulfur cluster biosynthetic enzyme
MTTSIDDVTEAMKDVVDPELGINVVDLGLIYDVMVDEANIAILNMTLTSAACPLQDVIEDQTRAALAGMTSDVKINNFLKKDLESIIAKSKIEKIKNLQKELQELQENVSNS